MHNDMSLIICTNQKISEDKWIQKKKLVTWNTIPKLVIEQSFEVFKWNSCGVISILNGKKSESEAGRSLAVFLILILLISNRYNFSAFYATAHWNFSWLLILAHSFKQCLGEWYFSARASCKALCIGSIHCIFLFIYLYFWLCGEYIVVIDRAWDPDRGILVEYFFVFVKIQKNNWLIFPYPEWTSLSEQKQTLPTETLHLIQRGQTSRRRHLRQSMQRHQREPRYLWHHSGPPPIQQHEWLLDPTPIQATATHLA
jgi:hypothetical protein